MAKQLDYRKELEKARQAIRDLPRSSDPATIDAYWEVCCGDVLVAEENQSEQMRSWENSSLARELLDIARFLEQFDHMLENLDTAICRMADALTDHPTLKLGLLELNLSVLRRLEAMGKSKSEEMEGLEEEIAFYTHNLELAARGEFDSIEDSGIVKHDPIEWSPQYESVIDEVERLLDEEFEGVPRGMGFCHGYWTAKAAILRDRFGILWRSPAAMNPGVLFD